MGIRFGSWNPAEKPDPVKRRGVYLKISSRLVGHPSIIRLRKGYPSLAPLGKMTVDLAVKAWWICCGIGTGCLGTPLPVSTREFLYPASVFPVDILPKRAVRSCQMSTQSEQERLELLQ